MSEGQRAKGRARGRAKTLPGEGPRPGQHSAGPAPQAAPTPSWPGAPGAQAAPPAASRGSAPPGFARPPGQGQPPAQQQRGPQQAASGGSQPGLEAGMAALAVRGGDGGAGAALGRGANRGRRTVESVVVTRPANANSKKGNHGRAVKLTANYFKLEKHTDWCLYQYRVDFAPEEDHTMVRKGLLKNHKDKLGGYIFDGTVLYTSHRLHPEPMELFSQRKSDETNVRISIRLVSDLAEGDAHYIQVFNILMRMSLGYLNLQLVGRNFFDALAKIEVRQYSLELWPGYLTSIRQHENDIMMCSEITHKVMRQDTALVALRECLQANARDYKSLYQAMMIGSVVLTDYNNQTYRIDDVDFESSPASTFPLKNGDQMPYTTYYRTKYGLNIAELGQPMLISRASPRERRAGQSELIYLVPELCRLTGLSDAMRTNFQLMRAVADHTRVGPEQRIDKLKRFNQRLSGTKEVASLFKEWNLKLSPNLVQFDGRVLPVETIVGGSKSTYPAGDKTDWTNFLRSKPQLVLGNLSGWAMITPNRLARDAVSFARTLSNAARSLQLVVPEPYIHEIPDDRSGTFVEALEQVISAKNPCLVLCVVTNNRADRYAAIKKKCYVDRAVPSQVVCAKNLNSKGVMSIATKVAIQMNCKIGGAPWTLQIPVAGLMVCGFDVCHDSGNRGRSFGALVCSLDAAFTRYFSAVSAHTTGEELSNDLSVNMMKALHKYREYNQGALPQRIIMYRDGVGEGQLPYVFEHEVELLKTNLTTAYGGPTFRMAFIIVTKRINTRIFLNNNNPPPGTIVDDVITLPEKYDFFLVSQSVRQGTVSPTSYNIISDNVGLDIDKLQRITYKLTHMYFNWSGTVRVPAPVQYAHKLAFLVGQSLHRSPSSQLEDSLYFL